MSLGLIQLHTPTVLLGQFCHKVILVRQRDDEVCRDMVLERKGPGLLPLSGIAHLIYGLLLVLTAGNLQGSFLSCLASNAGSSVLSVMSVLACRRMEDLLGLVGRVLGFDRVLCLRQVIAKGQLASAVPKPGGMVSKV